MPTVKPGEGSSMTNRHVHGHFFSHSHVNLDVFLCFCKFVSYVVFAMCTIFVAIANVAFVQCVRNLQLPNKAGAANFLCKEAAYARQDHTLQ